MTLGAETSISVKPRRTASPGRCGCPPAYPMSSRSGSWQSKTGAGSFFNAQRNFPDVNQRVNDLASVKSSTRSPSLGPIGIGPGWDAAAKSRKIDTPAGNGADKI